MSARHENPRDGVDEQPGHDPAGPVDSDPEGSDGVGRQDASAPPGASLGRAALWDEEAVTFDDAADHGLMDPDVRAAWRTMLLAAMPQPPAQVLDVGCGTGTLSCLLAGSGYQVHGIDFSPEMVRRARAKARDLADTSFDLGDAADPDPALGDVDVVLCRHVLWAMPEPVTTLKRWQRLLRPGGRMVLVEGRWANGIGLDAGTTGRMLREIGREAEVTPLVDPGYWGGAIDDERYLIVS